MIIKSLLLLTALITMACTSNDESAPAAAEPIAPETTEAKPAEEAPAAAESAPETAEPAPAATTESPAAQPATPAAGDFYIAVSHLNVRSGPGMANAAVEVLTFNTPVQSQGIENRIWVKLGEGRYVSKNYLSEQKLSQPMQVQTAPGQQTAPVETSAPAAEQPGTEQPVTEQPAV